MKPTSIALVSAGCILASCGTTGRSAAIPGAAGFDQGELSGWQSSSTAGSGPSATWAVRADKSAPSAPNVLSMVAVNHDSEDRFNLHWTSATRFGDGRLSVAVRADDGEVDQGGGPAWRIQDANNYYVCRFNPLEANFRVYVVKDGVRRQLATAIVDVDVGEWHRIEVLHVGERIECSLDGKKILHGHDTSIPGTGGVGVWTKADALTSFDDLGTAPAAP
jgi:hypothetical protein